MKSVVHNHNQAMNFLTKACRDLGEEFQKAQLLEIKEFKPPKTNPQNRKMHGMWRELAKFTGSSAANMKEYFKDTWGSDSDYPVIINGTAKIVKKSVADYSKMDCIDMIEHIYRVGSEAGYVFKADDVSCLNA